MNLHDEFFGICAELEAGVVNRKRINQFLRWTIEQEYSLYRRRFEDVVEIDVVKDAIVKRLSGLANGKKFDAVESATLLRKQFALLNPPVVDDPNSAKDKSKAKGQAKRKGKNDYWVELAIQSGMESRAERARYVFSKLDGKAQQEMLVEFEHCKTYRNKTYRTAKECAVAKIMRVLEDKEPKEPK